MGNPALIFWEPKGDVMSEMQEKRNKLIEFAKEIANKIGAKYPGEEKNEVILLVTEIMIVDDYYRPSK